MNIPTKLSFSRILALIPVVVFVLARSVPGNYLIACVIFSLASFTDLIDGMLARKLGQITDFGKFVDAIADKCLVTGSMMAMMSAPELFSGELGYGAYIYGMAGSILIITRDAVINGLRMSLAKKGVAMSSDFSGRAKTWAIDIAIGSLLGNGTLQYAPLYWIGIISFTVALVLTVWSGIKYLVKYGKWHLPIC